MGRRVFSRLTGLMALVAFVVSCGGARNPVPLPATRSAHTAASKSWMKPGSSSNDLLYVGSPHTNEVYVFTFPDGEAVGKLTGFDDPMGLCSDTNGNVWITNANYYGNGYLVEYAHGGTSPIATLQDTDSTPDACSVDPGTGNLAAGNLNSDIAVYTNAKGSPTFYSTVGFMEDVRTITYDGSGNLYFRSFRAGNNKAMLPKGGSSVVPFGVKSTGSYQWDGRDLIVRKKAGYRVERYRLSGSRGTKVGKLHINGCGYWGNVSIAGSTLISTCGSGVSLYKYPAGGDPTKTISGFEFAYGVTVSVAPSH